MESSTFCNKHMFDCRRHVKPGDLIRYSSMFASTSKNSALNPVTDTEAFGFCVAVYEAFVLVRREKTVECANRWNIRAVNGRAVTKAGCFGQRGRGNQL